MQVFTTRFFHYVILFLYLQQIILLSICLLLCSLSTLKFPMVAYPQNQVISRDWIHFPSTSVRFRMSSNIGCDSSFVICSFVSDCSDIHNLIHHLFSNALLLPLNSSMMFGQIIFCMVLVSNGVEQRTGYVFIYRS